MTTEKRASDGPSIRTIFNPEKLTPKAIRDAQDVAEDWKDRKVILDINWDKPFMKATNELQTYSFNVYSLDKKLYERNWMDYLGMGYQLFCQCFLAALVCFLGRWSLSSLQGLVRDCRNFVAVSPEDFRNWVNSGRLEEPHLLHDFLLLLPLDVSHEMAGVQMADILDYSGFIINSKRRDLPSIITMLTFDTCIKNYIAIAPSKQKALFYPVYLWWVISSIMPLRPVEFLVTPFDCIRSTSSGAWYLTLRRNRIKGTGRLKTYKIEEDFEAVEYQVPRYVADAIFEYIMFAKSFGFSSCPLGTLLFPQLHYKGTGMKLGTGSGHYTYANFNYALRRFHEDVLSMVYQYTVVSERPADGIPLPPKTISRVLPGDTRHLALINAARVGVQPQTLMEIVRHSTITELYWYAGNDDVLRSCATNQAYMEDKRRNEKLPTIPVVGYFSFDENSPFLEMHGGRCYSPHLNRIDAPDALDCIQSKGPRGELGWCPYCPYFRREDGMDQFDLGTLALDAETDWHLLLKTIDDYRKNCLHEDSLVTAFERARSGINILSDILTRTDFNTHNATEGENDATKEKA